jgi:hypothetical protein
MVDSKSSKQEEDPRDRFRRLLEESEKAEKEATQPVEVGMDDPAQPGSEPGGEVSWPGAEPGGRGQPPAQSGEFPAFDEKSTDVILPDIQPGETPTTPHPPSDRPLPPMLGDTPRIPTPALDPQGMPLPRRVDEIDVDATQVSPSAYSRSYDPVPDQPIRQHSPPSVVVNEKSQSGDQAGRFQGLSSCVIRMLILGLFGIVVIGILSGSFMLFQYYRTVKAEDWPDVGELYLRTSQFETTRIFDRNGNLLYEIMDPSAGRRTYVTLDEISPYLVAATIATEDKDFYSNPGFDPLAIARAFWQNLRSGETVSGASTITQQLAKSLFLTAEERSQVTYSRKVKEALLAAELTRLYSKDDILELYINEINYGNLSYGIEAASQTYFGTSAAQLNLAQASFLAGIPQLPAIYDIYTNREATLFRHEDVMLLMFQTSQEQGCI